MSEKDFCHPDGGSLRSEGVSYAGAPENNTVMFVSKKV